MPSGIRKESWQRENRNSQEIRMDRRPLHPNFYTRFCGLRPHDVKYILVESLKLQCQFG